MGMTVPYEQTGRVSQKARTRGALIDATRELLAEGTNPTMESAAGRASISRTTAYRYFPNLAALLAATFPHVEKQSLLGPDPPADPEARLEAVIEDQTHRILKYEPEMRAVLRLSLAGERPPGLPMHRGLRVTWIEDALAPLQGRVPEDRLKKLVHGIGATLGIEAFAWLTDIAGLSRDQAVEVMRSTASALLRSALIDP
jgi:AcrR family transcriptional regulator